MAVHTAHDHISAHDFAARARNIMTMAYGSTAPRITWNFLTLHIWMEPPSHTLPYILYGPPV